MSRASSADSLGLLDVGLIDCEFITCNAESATSNLRLKAVRCCCLATHLMRPYNTLETADQPRRLDGRSWFGAPPNQFATRVPRASGPTLVGMRM